MSSKEDIAVKYKRQSGLSISKQYSISYSEGREDRRARKVKDDQCTVCCGSYTDTMMKILEK